MSAIHPHSLQQQQQQQQLHHSSFENTLAEASANVSMTHQSQNSLVATLSASASASNSSSTSPTAAQTPVKPKKKRLNHNELERKRRYHQREVLYELRDVIPNLHMVKPSTVLIMQKSKEYIDLLRRTIQEMEAEINDLRRALIAAGYPLPMPSQQQPVLCGFPSQQPPPPFGSSCQSPRLLPEQLLAVGSQSHLSLDSNSQIPFHGLGELSLSRAHFDQHEIDSIGQLHSVLNKEAQVFATCTARPISPVSPYQLEQIQGCSSGEFKNQSSQSIIKTSNPGNDAIVAAAAAAAVVASGTSAPASASLGSHF